MNPLWRTPLSYTFVLGLLTLLTSCAWLHDSHNTLPELMVERLNWMDEVAAAKHAKSLPVTDPVREAELLRSMTQRGVAAGIPADSVRRFFTGQMQAAKVVQVAWVQQHPHGIPTSQTVPDLAKTVRPALDDIGRRMLQCLAHYHSPAEAAAILVDARQRLSRSGYSEAVMQPALDGLRAGLQVQKHP